MPKRFPERAYMDIQKSKEDETTRTKKFLTFVPQTKTREHLKAKIPQVRRKFVIA